jgi:hypothetical protein
MSEGLEEIEEILALIHAGKKLKRSEIAQISSILNDIEFQEFGRKLDADDIYQLLSALLQEPSWSDERLFEKFWDIQDPTTASLVMKRLCASKEGRKNYLERLLNLALGSDWDEDGDVQQDAIEYLGEFALEQRSAKEKNPLRREVLRLLLDIFMDEEARGEIRQWCYAALLRASGVAQEELPSRYAKYDFRPGNPIVKWDILEDLRAELT